MIRRLIAAAVPGVFLLSCAPPPPPSPEAATTRSDDWDRARLEETIAETERDFPELSHITTDQLDEWMRTDREMILLDVREAGEFAVSHLPGARWIDPDAPMVEAPKDIRIVAYCSVGVRSSHLAKRLVDAGFTDVHNLAGSIFKWANEGRVLVNDRDERVEVVHPYDDDWGRLLKPERRAD